MQSLIIPAVLLLLLGIWGAWEAGRSAREFQRRGKIWKEVCEAMQRGEGLLVVDSIWGPQRGLGHPTIWWMPTAVEDLGSIIEATEGGALLVRCPRGLKSIEALGAKFGTHRVRAHSWAIAPHSFSAAQQTP